MTDQEILQQHMASRQPVECWTRVTGYFRPVSQFNVGRSLNLMNVHGSQRKRLVVLVKC